MAHHNQVLFYASCQQLMHLGEITQAILRHLVVVALDKYLLALQPDEMLVVVAPCEIPDYVNEVIGLYGPVPVGNNRLIHLLDGAEWAAAMPADVVMAKM
jgi:hypothetical protein